jgi:hypothetical protein
MDYLHEIKVIYLAKGNQIPVFDSLAQVSNFRIALPPSAEKTHSQHVGAREVIEYFVGCKIKQFIFKVSS